MMFIARLLDDQKKNETLIARGVEGGAKMF